MDDEDEVRDMNLSSRPSREERRRVREREKIERGMERWGPHGTTSAFFMLAWLCHRHGCLLYSLTYLTHCQERAVELIQTIAVWCDRTGLQPDDWMQGERA